MGKDAHIRDTSRESRNSIGQNNESSADFYSKWKSNNQKPSKRQHQQERTDSAKRPHVDNDRNSVHHQTNQAKRLNEQQKVSESSNKKPQSSLVITKSPHNKGSLKKGQSLKWPCVSQEGAREVVPIQNKFDEQKVTTNGSFLTCSISE